MTTTSPNYPNSEIRKYRKEITPDYWMLRLHRFCLGSAPNFTGYCPLFWSTWFLILTIPFVLFGKAAEFGCKTMLRVLDCAGDTFFNFVSGRNKIKPPYKPTDEALVVLFEFLEEKSIQLGVLASYEDYELYYEFCNRLALPIPDLPSKVVNWANENPGWEDQYPAAKERIIKRKNRQKIWGTIRMKVGKCFGILVILCGAIALGALLFKLILILPFLFTQIWNFFSRAFCLVIQSCRRADWVMIGKGAKAAGFYGVGFAISTLIIWCVPVILAARGTKYCNNSKRVKMYYQKMTKEENPESPTLFSRILSIIRKIVAFPFGLIFGFVVFLFNTARLLYTRQCPLIVISDETKPITKNDKPLNH